MSTLEEFGFRLREYHNRINKRMNRLGGLFLGLVGIIILITILGVAFSLNAFFALIPLFMVGIALEGLYIIFSSRQWHKENGVFCDKCGKTLIVVSDI